jgi:transcriptional regulator with XRE-family HTH domain
MGRSGKSVFARRLSLAMQYSNHSQEKLATKLGVTRAAVSAWCTGATVPRLDRFEKIARALAVSTGYLHGEGDERLTPSDFDRLHHELLMNEGVDRRVSQKRLEEMNEFMRFLRAKTRRKVP